MAPVQGSKFSVLASPDDDEKKAKAKQQSQQQSTQAGKNAKQKAKKKAQQQAGESSKAPPPVKAAAPSKSSDTATSSSSTSKKQAAAGASSSTTTKQPTKEKEPKQSAKQSSPKKSPTKAASPERPKAPSETAFVHPKVSSFNYVQSSVLWCVSACYLFAFISFYYQIRGLYGDDGVLPLRHYAASLSPKNQSVTPDELYSQTGSLVWYVAQHGFSLTSALELITLAGVLVSLAQLFFGSFRIAPNYLFLFLCYYSIVKVGQTFLHFQWDALLLEVGTLTVLASIRGSLAPHSSLTLWPLRWLFFKLMFSSGVVKLTSRCPLWWSLGALDVHFESQCLPTSLAYYAHHLPTNWLHLATALTYVIEILGPFLFLVPLRGARTFSVVTQAFLQISIILTGNYNFFNLLSLTLCFALLEPKPRKCPAMARQQCQESSCMFKLALYGVFYGLLGFFIVHYFALSYDVTSVQSLLTGPSSRINFTLEDFNLFLTYAITGSIWMGVLSLVYTSIKAIISSLSSGCVFTRAIKFSATMATIVVCASVLAVSVVPLAELDTSGAYLRRVPVPLKKWYSTAQDAGIVSGYGLFRVMTGQGGRPELIVEGTNDPNSETWQQYHFKYKPGHLATAPRFNVPHQPRLDWQMWFAALGTYQANQWLLNFCYRLLTAQPDVLNLLDTTRLPFPPTAPPKYLRISRYLYKYTDLNESDWWKQTTNRHAYLPVVNKDTITAVLKLDEIAVPIWIQKLSTVEASQHPTVKLVLDQLYQNVVVRGATLLEPHCLMLGLVIVAFLYQWSKCSHNKSTTTDSNANVGQCPFSRNSCRT